MTGENRAQLNLDMNEDEALYPQDLGGEFGFQVGHVSYLDDDPAYVVQLPHQCDAWQIVWAADKPAAITQLEKFIAEAQVALTRLRELSP